MAIFSSRWHSLPGLLLCGAVLALPVSVSAECRVVEYPDRNEVVCEDSAVPQASQTQGRETVTPDTTAQKDFVFYSPVKAGAKIYISADLSPSAIAAPGDTLLSYRIDELLNKAVITTTASFVYVERTGDAAFTIREEGNSERADGSRVTQVGFDDKRNHLLLSPFKSGCSSSAADGIYLKMNRFEGSQLYYRIILPPCLKRQMEQGRVE